MSSPREQFNEVRADKRLRGLVYFGAYAVLIFVVAALVYFNSQSYPDTSAAQIHLIKSIVAALLAAAGVVFAVFAFVRASRLIREGVYRVPAIVTVVAVIAVPVLVWGILFLFIH